MQYCLYLRKSRADAEAEAHGEGETLARHEKILLELAKRYSYNVTEIYREIVSGETIAARPEMQRLLLDVEKGMWDGVLVMEVERLARGDTIDQGIMAQTFKYSGTKIITPMKVYDPTNEFDEEYFEFGLFMSRREYKTINRRLQAGRTASVKEGKYVGSTPPYGYRKIRLEHDKGFTLEPIPDQAKVVKLIFELYARGEADADGSHRRLGVSLICKKLNGMKIPSQKGNVWTVSSIRDMLVNPIYIGKIRWNRRPVKKQVSNGTVIKKRIHTPTKECVIVNGLHPAIIEEELFYKAQELMATNPPRPLHEKDVVKNPLAGIVICGKCGRRMVRRPKGPYQRRDVIMCPEPTCSNVSVALQYVEERIIHGLERWLNGYRLQWGSEIEAENNAAIEIQQAALEEANADLELLENQLSKAHDLLEQDVYTIDVFLERSRMLTDKIEDTKSTIASLCRSLEEEKARLNSRHVIIPKVERLLDVYWDLPSAQAKNDMLKEVLEKSVYTKNVSGRAKGEKEDNFELVLYPKLPYSEQIR